MLNIFLYNIIWAIQNDLKDISRPPNLLSSTPKLPPWRLNPADSVTVQPVRVNAPNTRRRQIYPSS